MTPTRRESLGYVLDNGQDDGLAFDPDPAVAAEIRTHLWLQRNARELSGEGA